VLTACGFFTPQLTWDGNDDRPTDFSPGLEPILDDVVSVFAPTLYKEFVGALGDIAVGHHCCQSVWHYDDVVGSSSLWFFHDDFGPRVVPTTPLIALTRCSGRHGFGMNTSHPAAYARCRSCSKAQAVSTSTWLL
jgi:hypothetical protein